MSAQPRTVFFARSLLGIAENPISEKLKKAFSPGRIWGNEHLSCLTAVTQGFAPPAFSHTIYVHSGSQPLNLGSEANCLTHLILDRESGTLPPPPTGDLLNSSAFHLSTLHFRVSQSHSRGDICQVIICFSSFRSV